MAMLYLFNFYISMTCYSSSQYTQKNTASTMIFFIYKLCGCLATLAEVQLLSQAVKALLFVFCIRCILSQQYIFIRHLLPIFTTDFEY
mmetsp:Transcript_1432/g.2629  ORF Transcript_1432/g.2629 Transcript_1432/m.2629 type:complete len:88 (+) Transcript_1432:716-979(+)